MIDDRYDRSADMRLLELQRETSGVPVRRLASTPYADAQVLADALRAEEQDELDEAEAEHARSGTVLVATVDARPRAALIAGSVVNVSLVIANNGDGGVRGVRMSLPLPIDVAYRPKTLTIDGAPANDDVAIDFFTDGAELGELQPHSRCSVDMQLEVQPGSSDVNMLAHVSASAGVVLGLRPMRLTRKVPPRRPIAAVHPLAVPADAPDEREAAAAALVRIVDKSAPPHEHATVIVLRGPDETASALPTVEAPARRKRRAKEKPADVDIAPAPIAEAVAAVKVEVVRSVDETIAFAGRGGPVLTVRIGRKHLGTLAGLFSGPSLGMIAHYFVLNALAGREPLPGDGVDGSIAAFCASQEQLLSRALISIRLGRTPTPEALSAALPVFPPALVARSDRGTIEAAPKHEARLFRAFQLSEVDFVTRMLANENAAPFLRNVQLLAGLCINDVAITEEAKRGRVSAALNAYAATATIEMGRIFVQAKRNPAPELFRLTAPEFDGAAREVIAALTSALD